MPDIAHAQRGPVAVGDDDVVVLLRPGQLVVDRDREAGLVAVERALGRVGGGRGQRAAQVLQGKAGSGQLGRIDLHPDGGLLLARDDDLGDAGHL